VKLSAKILKNVDSVNAFQYTENWVVRSENGAGENTSLYFQLVDLDRDQLRYIPATGDSLIVTFPSIDDAAVIQVIASFPYSEDRSIMKIDLLSTQLPSSGAVRFALTESGNTKKFAVQAAIQVEMINSGSC